MAARQGGEGLISGFLAIGFAGLAPGIGIALIAIAGFVVALLLALFGSGKAALIGGCICLVGIGLGMRRFVGSPVRVLGGVPALFITIALCAIVVGVLAAPAPLWPTLSLRLCSGGSCFSEVGSCISQGWSGFSELLVMAGPRNGEGLCLRQRGGRDGGSASAPGAARPASFISHKSRNPPGPSAFSYQHEGGVTSLPRCPHMPSPNA